LFFIYPLNVLNSFPIELKSANKNALLKKKI